MSVSGLIVEELKAEGIEVAEELAKNVVKAVFRALPKVVAATENKVDDLLLPAFAILEPKLLALVDDINQADNK